MSKCPYPETIWGNESSQKIPNPEYKAWHEGYEVYKLDMISQEKETPVCLPSNRREYQTTLRVIRQHA
jgi:hypothetical protein